MLKIIDEVLEDLIEGVYAQTNHISIYVKKNIRWYYGTIRNKFSSFF